MDDHIVKIIPSPKGKERIVILRRPDGTYTHYRQCRWNNHKAYSTAMFYGRPDDGWARPGPHCGIYVSPILAEQDALRDLSWPADAGLPAGGLDGDEYKSISELAELAEQILQSFVPTAFVQAQEWDNRIDCAVKLADGRVIGEMVGLEDVTEARIREAGSRLQQRLSGNEVPLKNEVLPPVMIVRGGDTGPAGKDLTDPDAAIASLPPELQPAFKLLIGLTSPQKPEPK